VKIIKKASGTKIKMSRKEWEAIGKQAGFWGNVGQFMEGFSNPNAPSGYLGMGGLSGGQASQPVQGFANNFRNFADSVATMSKELEGGALANQPNYIDKVSQFLNDMPRTLDGFKKELETIKQQQVEAQKQQEEQQKAQQEQEQQPAQGTQPTEGTQPAQQGA